MTIHVKQLAVALALVVAGIVPSARAQGNIDFAKIEIRTVKISDGVYVLMGGAAQGNILVLAGSDGLFLVDSMYGQMHEKIMDALRAISSQPIRFLVNTHLHGDHTGGNDAMARLGATLISHEIMRKEMAAQTSNQPPAAALPVLTYTDSITLRVNGEDVSIFHPAPAHTDGDSIVYFRHANVMHVGDVPSSLRYPNIGVNDGGSVDGMMAAARQVMNIANPNTKIIPGHLGPVVGFKEINQQLEMFTAVRERVLTAIREGKTEQQVVASKPTKDFDEGRMGGAITPDRFVSLVYTDLSRKEKGRVDAR
jgi:glyoxylase-like metal-dependent hydrolase (beta-lactamase superfamily II)